MENNQTDNKQLVQTSAPKAFSQKLIQCLINLEQPGNTSAKMDLVLHVGELMPAGRPQYLEVIKYPKITQLIEQMGKKQMLAVLVLMIKDFCSSLNVVRNMSEDQMIEAGAMLLNECGNFRLEDYAMMLTMAKKGELVKIYDRMDIEMLSKILDEYWNRRAIAGNKAQTEEIDRLDTLGPTTRKIEDLHVMDAKMLNAADGLAAGMEYMKSAYGEGPKETAAEATAKIIENPNPQKYPKK